MLGGAADDSRPGNSGELSVSYGNITSPILIGFFGGEHVKATFSAFSLLVLPVLCMAEQTVSFNRDVRPILSDRCFHCHGPNEHDRQADLRLDQADGPEGAYRTLDDSPAIKPGSIDGQRALVSDHDGG